MKNLLFIFVFLVIGSNINSQDCFVDFERIDDRTVRLTANNNTVNTVENDVSFGFEVGMLFETLPTDLFAIPIVSDNTLQINGIPVTQAFINPSFSGWSTGQAVTGDLTATGSLTLTYPDGVINSTGMQFNLFHSFANNLICMTSIVPDSEPESVPAMPFWLLGIFCILVIAFTSGLIWKGV